MATKKPSTVPHIVAAHDKSESVQTRLAADAANAKHKHAKHASEVADKELIRATDVAYEAKRRLDLAKIEAEETSKTAIAALQHQYGLVGEIRQWAGTIEIPAQDPPEKPPA